MKNFFRKFNSIRWVLTLILALGFGFRLYGLNWDQGTHLHPDERFLTMVATAIKIPENFSEYLNPQVSSMNPYNHNYNFFVYGSFPLNLTKVVGEITSNKEYWNIHFVGRALSAIFDLGVVFLLFKIGRIIFNQKAGLLAAFLYSIMVLPIQLSHFFAVDTFANFFLVLSFYFLILFLSPKRYHLTPISAALGASFGLALACKISALYFLPIIGLGFLFFLLKTKNFKHLAVCCLLFVFFILFFFRLGHPQAFFSGNFFDWKVNPQFLANLKELKSFNDPKSTFPPSLQWKSTQPIIFPLKNLVLWGIGLPLGTVAIAGAFFAIVSLLNSLMVKSKNNFYTLDAILSEIEKQAPLISYTLIILWILGLFFYQGTQFVKSMRYFLPIYPFLALLAAKFISDISSLLKEKLKSKFYLLSSIFYLLLLIYPFSFMSLYSHKLTRVQASEWIYENIPNNIVVLNEEWDDGLPVSLPGKSGQYQWITVFMYDPDTPEKWQRIQPKIDQADYIFLTSNRAYGPTMKLPELYPQTIAYYQSLFNSTGEFKKVAEFTSRPCFPPFGSKHLFCFNDDNAEEAFTVYDHPKVIIFKKNAQ